MSMIADVTELVKDLKALTRGNGGNSFTNMSEYLLGTKDVNNKSIKKRSRNAIMQFPILVSSSVSKENLVVISKALEQEYAIMMRIAMSQDDIVDLGQDGMRSKDDFLRKFHNNITFDATSIDDAVKAYGNVQESVSVLSLEEANKELIQPNESRLRRTSLNEATVSYHLFGEARQTFGSDREAEDEFDKSATASGSNDYVGGHSAAVTQLKEMDIRKTNDLVPTIMSASIRFLAGNSITDADVMFGIKCVSHLVPTEEMTHFLPRSVKTESILFKAIQWTTGEIKFLKDFVLNLDTIKDETSTNKNKSSRWWSRLKMMSKVNRIKASFGRGTKFIPNTTIVLTMDEVDYIKNTQGIDVLNTHTAMKIMQIFMLLGLVIVDENDESIMYYDDVAGTFNYHKIKSLARDVNSNSMSDLKTMMSLLGRR
jgi:hypothetical protein